MVNSMDREPGRARNDASRKDQNTEDRRPFPMGSIDSTVGESSQNKESWPLAPVQVIRKRGFQLFDEQSIVGYVSLNELSSFRLGIT